VFGFDQRTQRLLDGLGSRWRFLGPIKLIAGPDLAGAQMEPHEFFDFLNRKLSRQFIRGEDELADRIGESERGTDPDCRYRVHEFFCSEAIWRTAVSRLIAETDVVLMDVRGFSERNTGCSFELEQLVRIAELERVVLLVDESTDMDLLQSTLQQAWARCPPSSPEEDHSPPQVTLFRADRNGGATVSRLGELLVATASQRA